jgi:hypothetical protein
VATKTLTFDALRERNARALEKRAFLPDLDLGAVPTSMRQKTLELLDERAAIEDLASTQAQRETYGVERWHGEFLRVRDVAPPRFCDDVPAHRDQVWSRFPHGRFKRFQELFCHRENFVVPQCTVEDDGSLAFDRPLDLRALSLQGCLVSPDCIPDALAEGLRLCSFDGCKGDPLERLRRKRDAVQRLKLLWEAARPLEDGNHRILVVREPTAQLRERYAGVAGPDPAVIGALLYTREAENGAVVQNGAERKSKRRAARPPRKLVAQFFGSTYDAERKTHHETDAYRAEIDQLTGMETQLRLLNQRLDTQWRSGTPAAVRDALREEAQELLGTTALALQASVAPRKVQARAFLHEGASFTDSSGKQNVSSTMTKVVGATNRLRSRFKEMEPKGGYNHRDQMALQRAIRDHEMILRSFGSRLEQGSAVLSGNPLFETGSFSDAEILQEQADIVYRMGVWPGMFDENVRLEPFRTYAVRLREKCLAFRDALGSLDRDRVIEETVKMHVIGKFFRARSTFERMKSAMLDATRVPVEQIRNFARDLNTLFCSREVFPDVVVEGYREPFERMQAELEIIGRRLEHYAHQDMDIGARTDLYRRVKLYLERFDIEEIVRQLP